MPRRIGIVRLSAIGDVVHAMPLAMALREAHPRARLHWIVQEAAAPLLRGHPAVDEVLLFPRGAPLRRLWEFVRRLRALRLDATVDPQGNAKSGLLALLSGAPIRAGLRARDCKEWINAVATNRFARAPRGPHGVERAFAAGGPLGVAGSPPAFGLAAGREEIEAWRERARRAGIDPDRALLSIHLSDPSDDRSWFAEGYAAVAEAVLRRGVQVAINGTAARRDEADRLLRSVGAPGARDLVGKDDLRGLLAQFQAMASVRGSVLLAPDSGPVHLAVAAGLPVVCLAGPQDPRRTGPYRRGLSVRAWEGLSCAPCLERACVRRPPDRACMRAITPEAVLTSLEGFLG